MLYDPPLQLKKYPVKITGFSELLTLPDLSLQLEITLANIVMITIMVTN